MTHLSAGYTAADNPAIFYVPHADDESLSMGLDVANHLAAGRHVLLVLMTRGCSDYALGQINGQDDTYGYVHDPARESYHLGRALTKAELGQARINEFIAAAGQLNRSTGRLRVRGADFPDGTLTQAQAQQVMLDIDADLGGAGSHKAMTWTDPAPDHANCGKALRALKASGDITDARYYVSNTYLQQARDAGMNPLAVAAPAASVAAVRAALRCYDAWNPAVGAYAFGRHSVGAQITTQTTQPTQWYHA